MSEMPATGEQPTSRAADDDRAWVSIDTPLAPADLRAFLEDVERLYRINPLLVFEQFEGIAPDCYRMKARNLSNGRHVDTQLQVTKTAESVDVAYRDGLKVTTTFRVEPSGATSRLILTDTYGGSSEAEKRSGLAEVDLSLNAWGRAFHGYLRNWVRWRHLGPWRWYMARVWQPMTPSARRIVFLILAISVFEIATVAVVVLGWLILAIVQ